MSIIVDQVIALPSPPRGRKTTYEAGVDPALFGSGFMAFARYDAPNESFIISRRGRTKRAALAAVLDAVCDRWRVCRTRHLWKLQDAIDEEIART